MNLERLQTFLKPAATSFQLGISRFLFFSLVLVMTFPGKYANFSLPPKALWLEHSFYQFLPWDIPTYDIFVGLEVFWRVSLLMAALGLMTQVSVLLSFLLSLYILGIPMGFIPSDFHYQIPVLTMGVLVFAKSGTAFSVDRILRKSRPATEPQQEFGWPLKLILFLLCTMYFKAGVSKLRLAGLSWFSSSHLLANLSYARPGYRYYLPEWTEVIYQWLIHQETLLLLLSSMTVLLELFSLVPFFVPRTLPIFAIIWVSFHLGVYLLMGIWSSIWLLPVYAFLIPWDRLLKKRELGS